MVLEGRRRQRVDVAPKLAALHDGRRVSRRQPWPRDSGCSAGRELPRGVWAALGFGWLPDALRRWRRCSPAVSSRAEAAQVPRPQGEQGLHSLISVGIRTLGEELSGPARRRRGRRDGWFLLVAYRHASTPPQPKPFHKLCTTGRRRSFKLVLLLLCSRLCPRREPARSRARSAHSPADRQRPKETLPAGRRGAVLVRRRREPALSKTGNG